MQRTEEGSLLEALLKENIQQEMLVMMQEKRGGPYNLAGTYVSAYVMEIIAEVHFLN